MEKTNVQRDSGEQQKEEEEEKQKEEEEEEQQQQEEDADSSPTKPLVSGTMTKVIKVAAPVLVGVGAVVATPVVIGALGFGTAGIAAGSLAAKLMSLAATSGIGMSVISTCQSIGALAALSVSQAVAVGGTMTAATAGIGKFVGWLRKK
ncbi:interferon alpha-inducible protein 27-like protein 2B isoform X2 [Pomacea canaliculata]|nr:interferon alpha-inducible protein 27-like protein 2B isoform X2 [Pomacea canaliculata]